MRSRCSSSEQTITPYSLPALDLAAESAPAHQSQPASAVDGDRPRGSSAKTGTRPGPSTGSRNSLSLRHDQPGESRPSSEHSPDLSRSTSARSARLSSSLLPALRLAGLAPDPGRERERAREMRSSSRSSRDAPSKSKALLTLKLSASSFLDSVIRDDRTKDPLYILETGSEITTIYRLDHIHDVPVKTASVRWPIHPVRVKGKSGRSVQFGAGTWREAEDILKSGPLGNTAIRKFNIPHYPNSLKWKLIPGNCFCCVTSAVKGPVAVLDAATLSAPPRLKIYDALIDKEIARSQDNYKGIPTTLLDYLIVTSFLLVTDVQEWLDRPRDARIPGSSSFTVQRWLALIHHRPPPAEPDHPTVDLSLTVSSTPPHSATFPSPGGSWETQSGVTSLSGSNGSGSGASYLGETFSPTTPTTPTTSTTSAHSSSYFSREEAPPVPPVPGSSSGTSPFAYNVDSLLRVRERPKSNPHSLSHSPNSSTSTTQVHMEGSSSQADAEELTPASSFSLSSSLPSSTLPPSTAQSTTSSSSSRMARRLPVPPGPVPANSFAQPWLYSSSPVSSSSSPATTPSTTLSSVTPTTPSSATARAARASMRGSLRTATIPPPPPPPQHSIPLPPKLAQEQQGYAARMGSRPRTAPEIDGMGRRRHSAGDYGEFSQAGPSGTHPYALAAQTSQEVQDVSDRMHAMRMSTLPPGPLAAGGSRGPSGHLRAPSQPAPDYDAHSFVNVPPPALPPLPSPAGGLHAHSPTPPRRVLAVVNADAQSDTQSVASRPEPDLRLSDRMSYAESVYEAPPPAYDMIDFSVPPMSHLRAVHSMQPLHQLPPAPLPVPPMDNGGGSQRGP